MTYLKKKNKTILGAVKTAEYHDILPYPYFFTPLGETHLEQFWFPGIQRE